MTEKKKEPCPNIESQEEVDSANTTLVGWARQSVGGGALKISLHREAITSCHTYTTADGTDYIPLAISLSALRRVIDGEQSVTTVSQLGVSE